MQTGTKRVLIFGLFSLLLISLVGLVSAQTPNAIVSDAKTAGEIVFGSLQGFFTPLINMFFSDSQIALKIMFGIL